MTQVLNMGQQVKVCQSAGRGNIMDNSMHDTCALRNQSNLLFVDHQVKDEEDMQQPGNSCICVTCNASICACLTGNVLPLEGFKQ